MSLNDAKDVARKIKYFSENDENRAKQEKRLPMNPKIQNQVLKDLKERQGNILHAIRTKSASNPPKVFTKLGGRTRKHKRKHRKTRKLRLRQDRPIFSEELDKPFA